MEEGGKKDTNMSFMHFMGREDSSSLVGVEGFSMKHTSQVRSLLILMCIYVVTKFICIIDWLKYLAIQLIDLVEVNG